MEEATPAVAPLVVEYDPITGKSLETQISLKPILVMTMFLLNTVISVPSEFNEFLPKDSEEYKRWNEAQKNQAEGQLGDLNINDGDAGGAAPAPAVDAKASSSKKKKKGAPAVVLERNTRNKKKCITTITGLDIFGVKLAEASKLCGKKFASGASIVKNAEGKEQIDVQGDFLDQAVELILKQYGSSIKKSDIYYIESKKKERYFPDDDE